METLRNIILSSDTKSGRFFDFFIQILIVISLISFSLETLPDLSVTTYEALNNLETFIVVVFSIEYIRHYSKIRIDRLITISND